MFLNPQLFLSGYTATVHTQSGKKSICNESDNVWTGESGYFRIRWRSKFVYRLLPNNKPIWRHNSIAATIARFMAHAENTFYCRGALGTTVNPNTIGYVWTNEFDLNTLLVDWEIFWIRKEKVGGSKISQYVWTGPNWTESFPATATLLSRKNSIIIREPIFRLVSRPLLKGKHFLNYLHCLLLSNKARLICW